MSATNFYRFKYPIEDYLPDCLPIIARILCKRLPGLAETLHGENATKPENLEALYKRILSVTDQKPSRKEGHEYFTGLVNNGWPSLIANRSNKNSNRILETYYFLHTIEMGKVIATEIDRKLWDEDTYEDRFGPVPGGYCSPIPDAKPLVDSGPQPALQTKVYHELDAHYSRRKIEELLGRDDEKATVERFLKADDGFCWLQIAGEGGKGKSRLAYDYILRAKDFGYGKAGFLLRENLANFREHWKSWTPDKPHLIVFDYVIGAEAEIGKMMGILAQRKRKLRNKVRVLLVERQPWNKGGLQLAPPPANESEGNRLGPFELVDGQAEWFSQLNGASYEIANASLAHEEFRFESGIIELRKLRPDQLDTSKNRRIMS
ncbi:hypothetical protein J3E64_001559 [Sphingobium sp. OAS761]|uniref:hypothetical protein n=1 Tax=Sphingobium sp. OAS761 TaxID=2817901 RepID=UPI00209C9388|nr:hypothetical protein [Sphingobium sp. OAS761]MCP1469877.1 hypothetical protein [Sphingobium sp. OAS761]